MRKRNWKTGMLMAGMVIFLAGCGSDFLDMTQEEERMVGEYAANLLLKYDANNRSRLVSRDIVAEGYIEQEQTADNEIPDSTQTMDPVEDTPVVEIGQKQEGDMDAGSLTGFYGLPEGVTITYQGNEVLDSYTQDGEANDYFALDASEGKKLLVLKFKIENRSESEQPIDLLSRNTIIRVTVNGNRKYNILTTMLVNDMSTYKGNLPAGEGTDVVLLAEVDEENSDNLSTLNLQLKNDTRSCTIQLQ